MLSQFLIIMVLLMPLFCALLILLGGKGFSGFRENVSIAATVVCVGCMMPLVLLSFKGFVFEARLFQMLPNIWIMLRVDQLGIIFSLTAVILWMLATMYSYDYMKGEEALTRYYGFLTLTLSFIIGVAFAGNLFTLLLFYEMMSISCYVLIAHYETPEIMAAAKKYMIYVLFGSVFIIAGTVAVYFIAGNAGFGQVGVIPHSLSSLKLNAVFLCLIIGFGVKAAIMPLHGWIPDAHPAAPSPVSALLSGVIVASGCFAIMRVVYNVFGTVLVRALPAVNIVLFVAGATVIGGSLMALAQDDLKRRLAYSSVGQMSYIIIGILLLTPQGTSGAIIHIINHAFMKGVLFLCAGVLIKQAGKRNVSEMQGIASQYPFTMGAFVIASFGLIGVPPLAGFITKWLLCAGAIAAGRPGHLVIVLLGSLICAAYLLPVCSTALFSKGSENEKIKKPAFRENTPVSMQGPILIGTVLIIVLGLFAYNPGMPLSLIEITEKMFLR